MLKAKASQQSVISDKGPVSACGNRASQVHQLLRNSTRPCMSSADLAATSRRRRRSAREIIAQSHTKIPVSIGRLQVFFPSESILLAVTCFIVNQLKRDALGSRNNPACIVFLQTSSQIVRASRVKITIGFRVQHINVVHYLFHGPSLFAD